MLAASMFWLAISIRTMGEIGGLGAQRALILQSATMVALFTLLSWGLW